MRLEAQLVVPMALIAGFILLDRRIWALLAAQPEAEERVERAGLDESSPSILMCVGCALVAFYAAKLLGRPTLGLYLAIGILAVVGVVKCVVRLRAFADSQLPRHTRRHLTTTQVLCTVTYAMLLVAVLGYLQRWY